MTTEEIQSYIKHYTELPEALIFFGLTLLILIIIILLFVGYVSARGGNTGRGRSKGDKGSVAHITERFYEIIFSGTSILFFMASYYLIERFLSIEEYRKIWEKNHDYMLLALIILSCILNRFLGHIWVRLKLVTHEERASARLIGMLYMMLIFAYIKFIYENNNYDAFITYFICLIVGRFVYFDASLKDFVNTVKASVKDLPLMFVLLAFTGIMSFYGFKTKYLQTHIGVVTNVFFIHVYMCIAVFLVHLSHFTSLFSKKTKSRRAGRNLG